jgi:periplasmic divalent cation tolerance protein
MNARIVFVTATSIEEARKLAHAALNAKLVACAQILPAVESHYWWQGKLEQKTECLLLLKGDVTRLQELSEVIHKNHSYECPEFVAIEPDSVDPAYAQWWRETLD